MREMGGMFTFVGSQYRIEVEKNEYFIDLLLYHRSLKCMVAVELKVGVFMPDSEHPAARAAGNPPFAGTDSAVA